MAALANRWIDENRPAGWDTLGALAILNGLPSFERRHARVDGVA